MKLIVCLLCACFSLNAYDVRHSYVGSYVYEGNLNGKFKDNLVAVLEDGSQWKILERQEERFCDWEIGEAVRIKLRKSKDSDHEHQYRLYNYKRDEAVKVMPLSFGNNPLKVVVKAFYSVGEVPFNDYQMDVTLSDGSRWVTKGKTVKLGPTVYVGYNESKYFFISEKKEWMFVENFVL